MQALRNTVVKSPTGPRKREPENDSSVRCFDICCVHCNRNAETEEIFDSVRLRELCCKTIETVRISPSKRNVGVDNYAF